MEEAEREDRRIKKRIDEPLVFPDITEKGRIKKTILNFKTILYHYQLALRYDAIKREIIYSFTDSDLETSIGNNNDYEQFITYCTDICCKEGLPATRTDVMNWVYYIANEGRFNAVKRCLHEFYARYKGEPGEFDKFMDCIKFANNEEFSKMLFKKSLWQSIAMIHNENGEYGADGALTMQGDQGIGKTSLLRKMCECFDGAKYFKEGGAFDKAILKDDVLQNTANFICELGEATTSISMVDWIKRFITNPIDELRPPYGTKAKKFPRLTSFYLTVNDVEFLRDVENRRFWTVKVADINLNALSKIDYPKLWSEIYQLFLDNPAGFRLTVLERQMLNQINREFRILSKEERVIMDCYDWGEPREDWKEKTATEIATEVLEVTGQSIAPQKIGVALSNIGYSTESSEFPKRTLDGKSLYTTPKPHSKVETGCPMDASQKGKVLKLVK